MKSGVELIVEERKRQVDVEGFTGTHDILQNDDGQLERAATCYLMQARSCKHYVNPPKIWPWQDKWWKTEEDFRKRQLKCAVKAGALYRAEADRLEALRKESLEMVATCAKLIDELQRG